MKLLNKTKEKTISEKIRTLKTLKEKSLGLLGNDEPEAVHFKTRFGIHTAGMKFPIDIIVADSDMVVKKIKQNLKPGNFFIWNIKYNNIFELPAGTIEKTKTKVGDNLELK